MRKQNWCRFGGNNFRLSDSEERNKYVIFGDDGEDTKLKTVEHDVRFLQRSDMIAFPVDS